MVKVAVSRSAGAIRRGSNPLPRKACVAQMVEHLLCIGVRLRRKSYKQLKVLGSIPSIGKASQEATPLRRQKLLRKHFFLNLINPEKIGINCKFNKLFPYHIRDQPCIPPRAGITAYYLHHP